MKVQKRRQRMAAVIIAFYQDRGFGFARWPGMPDAYIHASAVKLDDIRKLHPGAVIEFDLVPSDKPGRMRAASVKVIK